MHLINFVLIKSLLICTVNGLNILAIFPYHGKSHFFVFEVYLKELAKKGHNVTVISHFPRKDAPSNYRDISIAGTVESVQDFFPIRQTYSSIINLVLYIIDTGSESCEAILINKEFQDLLSKKPKFDVIAVEQFNSDCALGIAYHFKAPVVGLTTHILMSWHYGRLGITYNPSYMSFLFLGGGVKPTLYQRIERVVLHFSFNWLYYIYSQNRDQRLLTKHLGETPPLEELARDIRFMFAYHNFILTQAMLLPSNVIEVGGFHVSAPGFLKDQNQDQDVQNLINFIEEAENGVIFISFGSVANASTLGFEKLNAIVRATMELPQRFIWRLKSGRNVFQNTSKDNLFIADWLPQVDILAHPKTQAFFSHCGMLSTTEALHYGVPMLAMPLFADQPANAAFVEESNLGVQIQVEDLTKEEILKAFHKILQPKFRENVKRLSKAWHDRPLSPLDTAIYWTEFAARQANFTFRALSADIPLYQISCLDVITILLIILLFKIFLFRFVVQLCFNKFATLIKTRYKSKLQ